MASDTTAIYLLVFAENGHKFGLDAAQIAEILRLRDVEILREDSGRIRAINREGSEIPVVEMAAVIGTERSAPDECARLVLFRTEQSILGFLIGEPEDIVPVEVSCLRNGLLCQT